MAESTAANVEAFERLVAAGRLPDTPENRERFSKYLAALERDDERLVLPTTRRQPGWEMSANRVYADDFLPRHEDELIYRGFPDTGYRIHRPRKRGKDGLVVGRRGHFYDNDEGETTFYPNHRGQPERGVIGQFVGPGDRVWCRVCGRLNELDWPQELQDPQAR